MFLVVLESNFLLTLCFIKIDSGILTLDEIFFIKLLLYGDGRSDNKTNKYNISFYKSNLFGKRFDGQLMRYKIKNTFLPCLNSNVCFIILTNQTMRCSLVCKFIVNSFIFWYHCKHMFL